MKNRSKGCKAFTDWSYGNIAKEIVDAIEDFRLFYECDPNGKIVAAGTLEVDAYNRILRLSHLVCVERKMLHKLLYRVNLLYPTFEFQAYRNDRLVKYNTERMKWLIFKLGV